MMTMLTAAETARVLRSTPWQIVLECRAGGLRASKPARTWLIEESAIREYVAAHSNGG